MSLDLRCSLPGETPVATVTWTIAPAQQKMDERWEKAVSRCKWRHEWSKKGYVFSFSKNYDTKPLRFYIFSAIL